MESLQKQPRIKSLPAFSIYRKFRLKEMDLNEVMITVGRARPGDCDTEPHIPVTIAVIDVVAQLEKLATMGRVPLKASLYRQPEKKPGYGRKHC